MAKFTILHAFSLKSSKDKLLLPGQYFSTEDEAQIKELREVFAKDGACKELAKEEKKVEKPAEKTVDPNDDISLVKGIGAKGADKLAAEGITTKSALKAAIAKDPAKLKDILGFQFEKVADQLK